ncbi:uncharacterized protein TM35_000131070 [Trypanosoma theileri]|uniref:Uncharacterized protein n=1 Tax=Trypanosoma theileri TaxID=67003 RepID=A0A1X0NXC2_9TRYP|nr:uncharacterized protein TM35_000131070 [Trypanosoma theileri]ORC89103.1 hypothetical protein TM35_000131070 [Trypanosoma theileri]
MESIPPKTRVAEGWVHPLLKKVMSESHQHNRSEDRVGLLERQKRELGNSMKSKEQLIVETKKELYQLQQRHDELLRQKKTEKYVYERIDDQLIVGKTLRRPESHELLRADDLQHPSCALTVNSLNSWGIVIPCFTIDEETRRRFFCQYAPFLTTSNDDNTMGKEVRDALFYEEMCLMDIDEGCCSNSACPYWHEKQIEHVKRGSQELISHMRLLTNGDCNICDVATFLFRSQVAIDASTDLMDAVKIRCDTVNSVANYGWAKTVMTYGKSIVWDAPLRCKPEISLEDITLLLREGEELSVWEQFINSLPEQSAATQLFQQRQDSLSWRCLMRIAGVQTEQLIWLAKHGMYLFPESPSIRLTYMWTLLRSNATTRECISECLKCSEEMAAYVVKTTLLSCDIQWSSTAARYIAYMIAITCMSVVEKDDVAGAELLLSTVLEAPGNFSLLPLAQQNFTMMLITLRERKQMEEMKALPLASISDVLFTFSEYLPHKLSEQSKRLLQKHCGFLSMCETQGIHMELIDSMKSAISVSLMRAHSTDLKRVEDILQQASIVTNMSFAELWSEYLRITEQCHGALHLLKLTKSLSENCQSPLLMFRLLQYLTFHGEDENIIRDKFIERFASSYGFSLKNVPIMALSDTPGIPAVDWIPFLILYSRQLNPRERIELLHGIPVSIYCKVVELVYLLLLETLHASILLEDDKLFGNCAFRSLYILREPLLLTFSSIDCGFEDMVSSAHVACWMVYKSIPVMVGSASHLTARYREIILDVGEQLHVLHPYLLQT